MRRSRNRSSRPSARPGSSGCDSSLGRSRSPGRERTCASNAARLLLVTPWDIASSSSGLRDPQVVGAAAGVGLLSSALPWSLELEALRRLPTNVFGVVLALEPVIAALMGSLFLHEHLNLRSWVAIGLVVTASAAAALEITRPRGEPPEA
ncbi:MAG TPA: EamA family transporter [Gaiellales bacterium]|nr:EamA family transporter [Gaiellales bacterium]